MAERVLIRLGCNVDGWRWRLRGTRGIGFSARGLHAPEREESALRGTHHGYGLGSAATAILRLPARLPGEAQAIHCVGVGGNDPGGETSLDGLPRVQLGDGGDGGLIARGTLLRHVGDRRRQRLGQHVQRVTGDGRGEVGKGFGDGHGLGRSAKGVTNIVVNISIVKGRADKPESVGIDNFIEDFLGSLRDGARSQRIGRQFVRTPRAPA
jgi:hypothetical protein